MIGDWGQWDEGNGAKGLHLLRKITLLRSPIRALVNMRIKEIGRGKGVRIIQTDNIPKAVEKLGLRFDGKNYYDQDGNIVLFVKSEFKIMEA